MTTDLERLADALQKDTPEKLLERRIEENKQEIIDALRKGEDYILDRERGLVIRRG